MKLYMRENVVIATHDDNQDVPANAYGKGVTIVQHEGSLADLSMLWDAPEEPEAEPVAVK